MTHTGISRFFFNVWVCIELLILLKKEDAYTCEERLLEIRLQFRKEMKRKYRIHVILVLVVWILIKKKTKQLMNI